MVIKLTFISINPYFISVKLLHQHISIEIDIHSSTPLLFRAEKSDVYQSQQNCSLTLAFLLHAIPISTDRAAPCSRPSAGYSEESVMDKRPLLLWKAVQGSTYNIALDSGRPYPYELCELGLIL